MGYSIFDAFKCNEDLFYTIYDYLRFVKPEKWNLFWDKYYYKNKIRYN